MSIRTVAQLLSLPIADARLLSLSKHRALAAYPGRPFDKLRVRPTSSLDGPSTSSGTVLRPTWTALRQAQGPSRNPSPNHSPHRIQHQIRNLEHAQAEEQLEAFDA